jgi:hypothetical protein
MRLSITRIMLLLMLICAVNRDTILHHESERQKMPRSVFPFLHRDVSNRRMEKITQWGA